MAPQGLLDPLERTPGTNLDPYIDVSVFLPSIHRTVLSMDDQLSFVHLPLLLLLLLLLPPPPLGCFMPLLATTTRLCCSMGSPTMTVQRW